MKSINCLAVLTGWLPLVAAGAGAGVDWVQYEGRGGPGAGKHIVFLSGDEEYRSEEGLPMLARILAARHGFKCTVLFAINPANHEIEPTIVTNIPGMESLDSADLCVMLLRFRDLPDQQMKHFVDYVEAGKPIIALRTSTHGFQAKHNPPGPYAKYDWQSKEWPGGFGRQVLGETWVDHHGRHGSESTRGVIEAGFSSHPMLRGVADIWGPTDVYSVIHLPADANILLRGQVLTGMNAGDPPLEGPKNHPMMPLVWTRGYTGDRGKTSKIVATTMGAAVDLQNEGLRRLLVNAAYWTLGLEVPDRAAVDYVGDYKPGWFGFGKFKPGVKPADLQAIPLQTESR